LRLDPGLTSVVTDAERLRVALVNLIVNARQAVAAGQPALAGGGAEPPAGAVTVSTQKTPDGVVLIVADAGVGIDQADLSRVFDPYFTTKRGGTGLGLPIAKNIIEGLGGTLAVASAPGRGTEIRIHLPLSS
jgi:signal transduction histidine kinase